MTGAVRPPDPPEYPCMMCGGPALDSPTGGETEWDYNERGELVATAFWVYCRACDCWTEHPVDAADPANS